MERQRYHGGLLKSNVPPPMTGRELVTFAGRFEGQACSFGLTEKHIDKHGLLIGSTGCGKTTLLNKMISQLYGKMSEDDIMIIFDSKGDFYKEFGTLPNTMVVGNSEEYYPFSERWNVFLEITADGEDDRHICANAREICKNLFADRLENTTNSFFPESAADLLASLMIFFVRTAREDKSFKGEYLNNQKFRQVLDESTREKLLKYLSFDSDMKSASSYIDGKGEQANGVIAEMQSVVREIFGGVFGEKGGFSMRELVQQKGKKLLFIEYDLAIGSVLEPVYRLLIDLALKEALGRSKGKGNVYLMCDEFRLVPRLQHIQNGVNAGRSLGLKVFCGLQNVEQMYDIYGESRGKSILAGFSNLFMFNTSDPSTLEYLTARFGKNVILDEYVNKNGNFDECTRGGNVIEDWDIVELCPGEAIVAPAFLPPFKFHFNER